jgi:hypothetical protein
MMDPTSTSPQQSAPSLLFTTSYPPAGGNAGGGAARTEDLAEVPQMMKGGEVGGVGVGEGAVRNFQESSIL